MPKSPAEHPHINPTPLATSLSPETVVHAYEALVSGRPIPPEMLLWLGFGPFGEAAGQGRAAMPHWRQRDIAVTPALRDALAARDDEVGGSVGRSLLMLIEALNEAMGSVGTVERFHLSSTYSEVALALALLRPMDQGRPLTALSIAYALSPAMPVDCRVAATEHALARLALLPVGIAGEAVAFRPWRILSPNIDPAIYGLKALPVAMDRYRRAASHLIAGAIDAALTGADEAFAVDGQNAKPLDQPLGVDVVDHPSLGAPLLIADLGAVQRALVEEADRDVASRPKKPFFKGLRENFCRILPWGHEPVGDPKALAPDYAAIWRRHAEPEGALGLDDLVIGGYWAEAAPDYRAFVGDPEPALREAESLGAPEDLVSALAKVLRAPRHDHLHATMALRTLERSFGFATTPDNAAWRAAGMLIIGAHATRLTLIEAWHGTPSVQWQVASSLAAMALGGDPDRDAARANAAFATLAALQRSRPDRRTDGAAEQTPIGRGDPRDPVLREVDGEILVDDEANRQMREAVPSRIIDAVAKARARSLGARVSLVRAALAWATLAARAEPIVDTAIGATLMHRRDPAGDIRTRNEELSDAARNFDGLLALGVKPQQVVLGEAEAADGCRRV